MIAMGLIAAAPSFYWGATDGLPSRWLTIVAILGGAILVVGVIAIASPTDRDPV